MPRPGEVQEAVILDDPTLSKIDIEDIKSFGDLGYQGSSDCRYTPPKWAKNQFRAIISNKWDRSSEPETSGRVRVEPGEFMPMTQSTFGALTDDDRDAVMKRFVTVVVGQRAIYVRPPSEQGSVPAYRFDDDSVMDDFLVTPGHKFFFGKWKNGENVEYDGYQAALLEEENLLNKVFQDTANVTDEKGLVQWWETAVLSKWPSAPYGAGSAGPAASDDAAGSSGRVKVEPATELTDAQIAAIMQKQERLAEHTKASGAIEVADSPSPPKRRNLGFAMPKVGARRAPTMDDEEADFDMDMDCDDVRDASRPPSNSDNVTAAGQGGEEFLKEFEAALEEYMDEMIAAGAAADGWGQDVAGADGKPCDAEGVDQGAAGGNL